MAGIALVSVTLLSDARALALGGFVNATLGSLLNDAVTYRDLPVLQAVTMVFAAGVVGFNLIADVLTVWLTPRLRTQGGK